MYRQDFFLRCYRARYVIKVLILWYWEGRFLRLCIHNRYIQDRAEKCGRPGQANNLELLETIILWNFSAWNRARESFEGADQNCQSFSRKFFDMWKPKFPSTILPTILVTFQCRYSLEPGSAARLARPLVRPCIYSPYMYNRALYIQGVPGGMCETSGECSLC